MPVVDGEQITYRQIRAQRLEYLRTSIDILAERWNTYQMTYTEDPSMPGQTYFPWYGRPDEEVMVCVFRGRALDETFHRHDFFFFNFAYAGDYRTLSYVPDNLLTVHEGELYVGQPYTGYALRGNPDEECTIVGVLVRKETFFNSFLQLASLNDALVDFFVSPLNNPHDDEFVLLHPGLGFPIRDLLENMICEYAHEKPDTQAVLKAYTLQLIIYTARQMAAEHPDPEPQGAFGEIAAYAKANAGHLSLSQIAQRFGYHPNYLSSLFKKELGKSYSEVVLETRMERAAVLLRESNLSVEAVAQMLGYASASHFHKAFNRYYGCSPRQYAAQGKASGAVGAV